ncbi:MAG: hypothetical protein ACI8P9_003632 [Parasphingorhabdus sp.]|jgi:hypothetical protein
MFKIQSFLQHVGLVLKSMAALLFLSLSLINQGYAQGSLTVLEETLENVHINLSINQTGYGIALIKHCSNCTESLSKSINPNTRFFVNNIETTANAFNPQLNSIITIFYRSDINTITRIKSSSH